MYDVCYMMKPLIHPYTMSLRITLEHCKLTLYPWNLSGVGRGRYGHVWWDLHVTIGFLGIICCQWLPKNGGILHIVSWSRITILSNTTETYRNCVPQIDANSAMKSKQHGINNIRFLIHISDILTPIIYKPKSTYWTCVFCKLNKQTTSSYFSLPFSWLSSFLSSFPSWRPALQVSPVAFFVPELITVCCWRVSQDKRKIYLPLKLKESELHLHYHTCLSCWNFLKLCNLGSIVEGIWHHVACLRPFYLSDWPYQVVQDFLPSRVWSIKHPPISCILGSCGLKLSIALCECQYPTMPWSTI